MLVTQSGKPKAQIALVLSKICLQDGHLNPSPTSWRSLLILWKHLGKNIIYLLYRFIHFLRRLREATITSGMTPMYDIPEPVNLIIKAFNPMMIDFIRHDRNHGIRFHGFHLKLSFFKCQALFLLS